VGHRRWLFYPQTQLMGMGTVPASSDGAYAGANATWIFDSMQLSPRPQVRDDGVAWPPRGYVPYQVVYGRWSYSYPKANFNAALVKVSYRGKDVPVHIEPQGNYGEPTIVWTLAGTDDYTVWPRPAQDERYQVTISNIIVDGLAREVRYETVVIDPAVPSAGSTPATIAAPARPSKGKDFAVTPGGVPGASGYEVAAFSRSALQGPELGLASAWELTNAAAGDFADGEQLHLWHAQLAGAPALTWRTALLVGSSDATLSFQRSRGLVMDTQTLHVEASLGGDAWTELYADTAAGARTEQVSIRLAQYAQRIIQLRIRLDSAPGSPVYICKTDLQCGWRLSAFAAKGVEQLQPVSTRLYPQTATLRLDKPGSFALAARPQFQSRYFGDWGRVSSLQVDGAILTGSRSNYTVERTGDTITVTDNTGKDGVQKVNAAQTLEFSDLTMAFDTQGSAVKAYRLYQAAFDRAPDAAGLGYWVAMLEQGLTPEAMVQSFIDSSEFRTLYGSNPSNADTLTRLYRNVLHRAPDEGGYAFWLKNLDGGTRLQVVLSEFSEGPENRAQVAAATANGVAFKPYR
jgi:hypothetical protein